MRAGDDLLLLVASIAHEANRTHFPGGAGGVRIRPYEDFEATSLGPRAEVSGVVYLEVR